jgi:hypothetical protein
MWRALPLTWISNLFQDSKIRFNFKSNITSAISNFSKLQHLASYVSCHNPMANDNLGAVGCEEDVFVDKESINR